MSQPYDPPPRNVTRPLSRRPPVWLVVAGAVALLVAVGAIVAGLGGRQAYAVPKKDVPAFRLITANDLEQKELWRAPDDAIATRADLVGRYTRSALPSGEPVTKAAVTAPVSRPDDYEGPRLRLIPARSSAKEARPGQFVRLRFAPLAETQAAGATVDALLLDVATTSAGASELVVLLRRRGDAARVLDLVGRADLLVTAAG